MPQHDDHDHDIEHGHRDTPGRGHRKPPRCGRGRFTSTLDSSGRDAAAAQLRAQGATYDEIARRLGWTDKSAAHKAVSRALAAVPADAVDQLRQVEDLHLHALRARAWAIVENPGPLVSEGRVIKDTGGEPLEDENTRLRAIGQCSRVSAQRSRLWGLDAPQAHKITTSSDVDDEIARLFAQHEQQVRADERQRLAGPEGAA